MRLTVRKPLPVATAAGSPPAFNFSGPDADRENFSWSHGREFHGCMNGVQPEAQRHNPADLRLN